MSIFARLLGYESEHIQTNDRGYGPTGGPHEVDPDYLDDAQLLQAMSSYNWRYGSNMENIQWLHQEIQPLLSSHVTNIYSSNYGIVLHVGNIRVYIRNIAGHWGCHFKHILSDPQPFYDIGAEVHIEHGIWPGTTILVRPQAMNNNNILTVLELLSLINDNDFDIKEPEML
jgi:hypothetical protein